MKSFLNVTSLGVVISLMTSTASAQLTIPTVPIGSPGNGPNPAYSGLGLGAVEYSYAIGTTEVTNAQYTVFLNAVAATDPYNLYNESMSGATGGIVRTGSSGSYTYSTVTGRSNHPVNYVSFWDAARFANWLHNGQGNGDTETGAYTLTAGGISANTITRNPGWLWAVASENEWHKAAYFQPSNQGGDVDSYWEYPTSSNFAPSTSQANVLGAGINNTVPVGSYSANFSGTFDMAGNVAEWVDTITGPNRLILGGSYFNFPAGTGAGVRNFDVPTTESALYGFRVATIPAPSAAAILAIGWLGAFRRRR
jgi:formylglycine-generating enzyme required for sulfatase activity